MANNTCKSATIKFKEVEAIDFNTDLSTQGDRRLTLDRKASYLEVPDVIKRHFLVRFIRFTHKPKGTLHYKISICDSGKLKIHKGGEFLKCRLGDSSAYMAEGDFEADGNTNKFPIDFNLCPSAVEDYDEILKDDTECVITFNLAITCEKDKEFEDFIENGEIKLNIPKVRPKVKFLYTPECKEMIYTMKTQEPCRVGTLKVYHSSKLKCAPNIEQANYSIHTIVENYGNEKKEEHQDYPTALYRLKAGRHHNSCKVSVGSELSVSCLQRGQEFEIPVLLDMNSVMANPHSSDIVFKLQLRSNEKNKTIEDSRFVLKRNRCLTRLEAKLSTQDREWDILADKCASQPCPMNLKVGATVNHELVFRNTADAHPGANIHSCVKVWGVNLAVKIDESASKRIKLQADKTISDVVGLYRTQSTERISENDWVDLDPMKQWKMIIRFYSQYIKWIDPDPSASETWIPVIITLSYNYIEDSAGVTYRHEPKTIAQGIEKVNRIFTYEVRLTKVSISPWLCVDFGTSAIVAASASFEKGDLNLSLINLNERKNDLLAKAFPDKKSNKDEEGVLINSTLCLNPSPDLNHVFDKVTGVDSDFKKYALLLSPGDDVLNADYMTPNLKLLMGYDKIPNIFSVIQKTFQYAVQKGIDKNRQPIIKPRYLVENEGSTDLMRPDVITKIVYLQLFKHYLRITANNIQQRIERLVMTVPNTYTPLQLDFIRRIAREALPELRPEEFHLVSESDAVACYYLYKRDALLKQMKDANPSIFNSPERRVLIYDMGAGTLDLTLMQTTKEHDSLSVKMLGKLGMSKAGNYFDYVLGQILVEAVQEKGTSTQILGSNEVIRKLGADHLAGLVTIDANSGLGASKERLALKNYIKEMKKLLNSNESNHLNDLPEDNEIAKWAANAGVTYNFGALTVKYIRTHNLYKEYVRGVTTDLLKDFQAYVCQSNPEFKLQEIDVVVFSGRSTQLMDIRLNVKDALKKNSHIYYVDLISETSSTNIDKVVEKREISTKLKTVVAEGAYHFINFMNNSNAVELDSRKIFASFGIVQYDTTQEGLRTWTPLVIAQTPCQGEGIKVEECQSYIKVSRKITVNGNRYVDLVQSYCGDVVGCNDYSSNETISVLTSIELPKGTKEADVEFTLYKEPVNGMSKSIHLKIGKDEYDVNPHVDIQRNTALRRSLWPVVFS